ncbi:hypothetical protein [Pantoea sp. AMG 501]|uniref:hypothetical protein n=1 Tax=Pantoea sp. AMG 501 TaxID=2008894 RepID=UPI000B5A6DF3|nr:hypothetical protein [Pantoea sp. AMG 501]OWY74846.1 hypothetical protein CDN97_21665 [Pantoea sp. AMG 501]
MNTHNVKTAASESTETRVLRTNVNGLPSGATQTLAFLDHLAEDGMEEGERAELLLGSLLSLAEALRDAVPDWSARRPRLPFPLVRAWLAARDVALAQFGETGQGAWAYALNYLRTELDAGFYFWRDNIW